MQVYVRHLVHLFSIFSLHKLLLQNLSTRVLNIEMPRQGKAIVPSLIKCDWGLFLAVVQSCFESSVNALPWINVICGISQVAAGLFQCGGRQPENSRKHPTFTTACSHFLLFIYSQCRTSDHTHQPRPKGSPKPFLKFNQKHTGVSFPLATPARSVCDGLQSFICAARCTNRLSVQQTERKLFGSFYYIKIYCCECVPECQEGFLAKTL